MKVSVSLCNITKQYGRLLANDNINIDAQSGDVHAILGENGAGKTTLMKVLAGNIIPNSGYIELDGERRTFRNPRVAVRAGIGMVHQHFALVPALTVQENLALGWKNGSFVFNSRRWRKQLLHHAKRIGIEIKPEVPVWQLSLGERQRLEVFRLIMEGARILILDEPTSILAPHEAENLFGHIRRFANAGHAIFLVSHKIKHVMAIANRITVLRRGKLVATGKANQFSERKLAELMVGGQRSCNENTNVQKDDSSTPVKLGKPVLKVSGLSVAPLSCLKGLRGIDFQIRPGEILGVAGVSGNGQDEMVAALVGLKDYEGIVKFDGSDGKTFSRQQLAFVPADRINVGVAASLNLRDNLALLNYAEKKFLYGPFLRSKRIDAYARDRIRRFDIRPAKLSTEARLLSGGNIQKAILSRELDGDPSVILTVNPTAGLDIVTVEFVHRELRRQAQRGAGVLVVSEDLDELLEICDRLIVLFEGQCVGSFDTSLVDRHELGLLMSRGVSQKENDECDTVNKGKNQ